jgi:hypothetical protein
MIAHRILSATGLVTAAWIAGARAGTVEKALPLETIQESCITGDLGVDFTSSYVFYGIPQENQGIIAQPYADFSFKLSEGQGALTRASLDLGLWSSLHSHRSPFAEGKPSLWYEFDFLAGLALEFGHLTVTPGYLLYCSPNDSYAKGQNVSVRIDYDDSDRRRKRGLHPHAIAVFEVEGKSGSGEHRGIYWELGVGPEFIAGPVTISVPITVALGSHGFYGDGENAGSEDTFGFFSAGLAAEWPLAFVPREFGSWVLKANATYYHLGRNAAAAGASDGSGATSGERDLYVFGLGVVVRF